MKSKDTLVLIALLLTAPCLAVAQMSTSSRTACVAGFADSYPCSQVDLLAHLSVQDLGLGEASEALDLWGWTDPETGKEYALVGLDDRTAFVDISFPENPILVGHLPHSGAGRSGWRDIKVYADHAYVVADRAGLHGLQVFDLRQLREVSGTPVIFSMTAHYNGFGSAHNVAVNEESGFVYVVGARGGESCGGGLHMVNVEIPDQPRFVGCFAHEGTGRADTGYTHDVQCVLYTGPDQDYQGREICFGSNETAVSIADVTVKGQPTALAKAEYPGVAYAHQGWLTEDQRYFFLGDELDERAGSPARTLIFDVADLDDPVFLSEYLAPVRSIDHNMYILGDFLFQANYTAGLRIIDIADIESPAEIGFFDTTPHFGGTSFAGAWSAYPYFASRTIAVSSIGEGLFLLRSTHPALSVGREAQTELPAEFDIDAVYPNPFSDRVRVNLQVHRPGTLKLALTDLLGREVAVLHDARVGAGAIELPLRIEGLPAGTYLLQVEMHGSRQTRLLTRQ